MILGRSRQARGAVIYHCYKFVAFAIAISFLLFLPVKPVFASSMEEAESHMEVSSSTLYSTPFSKKGADTCLKCHDEDYPFPVMDIFSTAHGNPNNARSPMAQMQCESCHGPGGLHELEPFVGKKRAPIIAFGKSSKVSVEKQNSMCLQCHKAHQGLTWTGSEHQNQGLLCVNCHKLHAKRDPVLDTKNQAGVCFQCHKKQRAEFERASAHPVRFGKMQCSQCHNPHGGALSSRGLLLESNINTSCYRCHAEKRGPFLWAHAPVSENCTICHNAHGSIHKALLKKRAPLLCQQCHSVAGHPSIAYTSSGLADQTPNPFLLAKSCLNCHFQVHGSNHPSGVKLMR